MFSAYKIAVEIVAKNTASDAILIVTRQITGLGQHVDSLAKKWESVAKAVAGTVAIMGGAAMARGVTAVIKAGVGLEQQQARMLAAGMTNQAVAEATATAWSTTSQVVGQKVTDVLTTIQGLRNLLGNPEEANAMAVPAAKLGVVIRGITGRDDSEEQSAQFFRFLENIGATINKQTGKIDPGRLLEMGNLAAAIIAATHGHGTEVLPLDLAMFQQQAGTAGALLDETGLVEMVPIISAMKSIGGGGGGHGSRSGTGLFQELKSFLSGHFSAQTLQWLEHLHMIDESKVHLKGRGSTAHYILDPGALKDAKLLAERPAEWIWNVLGAAMKKAGETAPDDEAMSAMASGLSATVIRLMGEMLRNEAQFKKTIDNINAARGVDQYAVMAAAPKALIDDFNAAISNFMTALGAPEVKDAMGALAFLTRGIKNFTGDMVAHQTAVQVTVSLFAALAAALLVIGGVAIVAAIAPLVGTGGLIAGLVVGIISLGTALTSLFHVFDKANGAGEPQINHPPWYLGGDASIGADTGFAPPSPPSLPPSSPSPWLPLGNQVAPTQPSSGAPSHFVPLGKDVVPHNDRPVPVIVINHDDIAGAVGARQSREMLRNPSDHIDFNLQHNFFAPGIPIFGGT